jgi:hypothetical protein
MDRPDLLEFDVAYPSRLKRWLIFFRGLLIIPHTFVLYLLAMALGIVTFFAWWAILFTGRYPEGMWSFSMSVMRWNARVQTYLIGLRDDYPPFGDQPYPMTFSLAYPQRQARWLLFLRPFLIIPHYFCLMFVGFAAGIVAIVAWLAVLFLGRMPEGMFSFLVGTYRWSYRVTVYMYMLTDAYPPFSLGETPAVSASGSPAFAGHA